MAPKIESSRRRAALPAFLMKLATVSLGCAPLLTQYLARSRLSVKLSPFFNG